MFVKVVVSWLGNNNQSSSGTYTRTGKGVQCPDGSADTRRILKLHSSRSSFCENWNWIKACCTQTDVENNPIDCLNLWHGVIMKDFQEILEELYQLRSSSSFSNLHSIIIRLKFLVDILSFYRYLIRLLKHFLLTDTTYLIRLLIRISLSLFLT